ncbi:MAG: hypothetical protein P8P85_10910, partial [Acidimicrobiales bacterium]|nr:hypothetical protein [Acidimicrobiales bacterium]
GFGVTGEPYDGLATSYWADISDLEAALDSRQGALAYQAILEDEENFIDTRRSYLSFGMVHPIARDRSGIGARKRDKYFRGAYFPEKLPQLDMTEMQRHWIAVHGGMSQEFTAWSSNKQYLQIHCRETELSERFRRDREMKFRPHYFGHADVLTSSEEIRLRGSLPDADEIGQWSLDDIDSFADPATGWFIIGKEYSVIDRAIYQEPIPIPRTNKQLKRIAKARAKRLRKTGSDGYGPRSIEECVWL